MEWNEKSTYFNLRSFYTNKRTIGGNNNNNRKKANNYFGRSVLFMSILLGASIFLSMLATALFCHPHLPHIAMDSYYILKMIMRMPGRKSNSVFVCVLLREKKHTFSHSEWDEKEIENEDSGNGHALLKMNKNIRIIVIFYIYHSISITINPNTHTHTCTHWDICCTRSLNLVFIISHFVSLSQWFSLPNIDSYDDFNSVDICRWSDFLFVGVVSHLIFCISIFISQLISLSI